MSAIEKLLSISTGSICPSPAAMQSDEYLRFGRLAEELLAVLRQRNGFYAFESALHVFPAARECEAMTLQKWNTHDLWRYEYADLAEGMLFFAEDAFGDQFCIKSDHICRFWSETAEVHAFADSLEDWAKLILDDFNVHTGYSLADEVQRRDGPLMSNERLFCKTPFFLGGEHKAENLCANDAVDGMRFKGSLARQTHGLPDGSQIELNFSD